MRKPRRRQEVRTETAQTMGLRLAERPARLADLLDLRSLIVEMLDPRLLELPLQPARCRLARALIAESLA